VPAGRVIALVGPNGAGKVHGAAGRHLDPVQGSSRDNLGDWSFDVRGVDSSGQRMSQAQLDALYNQFRLEGGKGAITQHLHDDGVRFSDFYQPADRFWDSRASRLPSFWWRLPQCWPSPSGRSAPDPADP